MKKFLACVLSALAFLSFSAAPADAARPNRDATLVVNPPAPVVGDALVFSGCGYQPGAPVGVTVMSPYAYSFSGAIADSGGCFSTATTWVYRPNEAGSYTALTFQSRDNKPDASVTFTVTE